MQKRMSKPKKIILSIAAVIILILGVTAYLYADRFLIPHVQMVLSNTSAVSVPSISSANSVDLVSSTEQSTTSEQNTGVQTVQPTVPIHTDAANGEPYTATATSYSSKSTNISIKTVSTGSGKNKVTYFVADVQIADATQMLSAFAKNEFGTNIIEYVSTISKRNDAIFAVNGDYYGFRNDGVEIRNGVLYRDKPARQGLALYKDGTMKAYDEKSVTADQLLADGVWNTFSFGPCILDNGEIPAGISQAKVDSTRPIQGLQPRTGIGLISANHFIFVVVDGRDEGYSKGVTMTEFAQIFKDLGCSIAYNLDGGGSTEMWFMGHVVNYPCNGNGDERATSDIIYIK
ncbi:MAG: phosphodiester glycosidase family protein [Oscillospiraceae bacterium]|nr:phosphodiester glycosidase family protein [Oscillospiraceae bacterium]